MGDDAELLSFSQIIPEIIWYTHRESGESWGIWQEEGDVVEEMQKK